MNQAASSSSCSASGSGSTSTSFSGSGSSQTTSSSPSINSLPPSSGLKSDSYPSSSPKPHSTPSLQEDNDDEDDSSSNSHSVWTRSRPFPSSSCSHSDDDDDLIPFHSGTTPTLTRSNQHHHAISPSDTASATSSSSISNPIDFDPMDLSPAQPFLPHHELGNRPNLENTLRASKMLQPITGLEMEIDDAKMGNEDGGGRVRIEETEGGVWIRRDQENRAQHIGLAAHYPQLQPFATPSAISSRTHQGGDLERRFATHVSMTPPANFGSRTSHQSPFAIAVKDDSTSIKAGGSTKKVGGNVGSSKLGPSFKSVSHNYNRQLSPSIPRSHGSNSLAALPSQSSQRVTEKLSRPSQEPIVFSDPNETPIKSRLIKTRSASTTTTISPSNPQCSPQKRGLSHGRSQSQGGPALGGMNAGGLRRTFPLSQSLRKGNSTSVNGNLTSSSGSEESQDEGNDSFPHQDNFRSRKGKQRSLGRVFGGSDPMSDGTGLGLDLGEEDEEGRDWVNGSSTRAGNVKMSSRSRARTEGNSNNTTSAVASRRGRAPAMLKVSSGSGFSSGSSSAGSLKQRQLFPGKDEMDIDEPGFSNSEEEGGEIPHLASPTPAVWDVAFPTSSSPFSSKADLSVVEDGRMHELQPGPQQLLRKPMKGRRSRTASSNAGSGSGSGGISSLGQSPPSFNIQAATPKSPSAPEFRGLGLSLGPSPSSSTSKVFKHSTLEQSIGALQSKSLSAATGNTKSSSSPFKTPYKRRTSSNASERPRNRTMSSASASNPNGLLDFSIPRSSSASSASSSTKLSLDLDERLKGSATLFGFASPNRNPSLSSASRNQNDLNVNSRVNLLSYSAPRPTANPPDFALGNGTTSVGGGIGGGKNRLFSGESLPPSNQDVISTPLKLNDHKKNVIQRSLVSSVKNGRELDDSGVAFGGDSPSVEAALRNGHHQGSSFDPKKELLFQTERRLANRLGVSEDANHSVASSPNTCSNSIQKRTSFGDFSSPAKARPSSLHSASSSPNSFSPKKTGSPMFAPASSSTPLKKSSLLPTFQKQPRERSSLANETKLSSSNSNGSSIGDDSEEGNVPGLGRPAINRLRSGSGSNLHTIGRPADLSSLEMARKVSTGSIGLGGGYSQAIKSASDSSSNSGFATPYKNVKPLQTAFMSTGLVSKRARMNTNDGLASSGNGNGGDASFNDLPIPRPNFASALGLREVVAAAAQVQSSSTATGNGVGPMPDTPVKKPVSMMLSAGGGGVPRSSKTHQMDSNFNRACEPSPSSLTSTSNTSSGGNSGESPQVPDSCDSPTLNLLSVNGGFPELGSSNESSSSFSSSVGIGSSSMGRVNSNNGSGKHLMNRVSKGSPNELNQWQSLARNLPRHHLHRQDAFIGTFPVDPSASPASPPLGDFHNSVLRSPSSRSADDDLIENQVLRKGRGEGPSPSTSGRASPSLNHTTKRDALSLQNANLNASKVSAPFGSSLSSQHTPFSNSTNSARSSASSSDFAGNTKRNQRSHPPKVRLNHNPASPRPKAFGARPPLGLARKSSFGVSSEQAIQMAMDGSSMNMAGSSSFASSHLGSDGVPMTPTRNGAILKWFEAAQIVTTPSPSHRKSNGSLPRSHRTRSLASAVHQELHESLTPAKTRALGTSIKVQSESISKFQNQFVVQSVLGQGVFSEAVKVVEKTQDGAVYAIKRMKKPFVGQKDRLRHLEEVDILRHLSSGGGHPNVISLVDAWEELGHLFIQTELCPLGTLGFFLEVYCGQVGNLDEPRLWKILTELSDGVHFIHGKGVLHLDLKPANIFITEIGTLKIGDFGMATRWPLLEAEDILNGAGISASDPRSAPKPASTSIATASSRRRRRSNMRITDREGDREYLAPEILEGKYSKAADMFCLGLIMLEAAGSVILPDNGDSWQKLRHDDFSEVDLSELSQPFISIVYRLLSSQAHQRPTVKELVSHPVLSAVRKRMARGLLHSELDQLPDFEINSKDNKMEDCSFGNISLGKIFESEQANDRDHDGDETMNDGEYEGDRTNDSILGLSGVQRDQRVVVDVRGALIQETDEDFLTEVLSSIDAIGHTDGVSTAAFLACSSPRSQISFSKIRPVRDSTSSRLSPSQSYSNHTHSLSESNAEFTATRSSSSPANMSPEVEDPNAMDLDEGTEEDEDEDEFFGSHQTVFNHNQSQAGSVL